MHLESEKFGSGGFNIEDRNQNVIDCNEFNTLSILQQFWFLIPTKFPPISINLNFYKETCVRLCPHFSEAPVHYRIESTFSVTKTVFTIVGCLMCVTSSYLVRKVWFLYSFIGFFVGGILWTYGMCLLLKNIPKIPNRLKYQMMLCIIPILTGTTYGITFYFRKCLLCSIVAFYCVGIMATYWYGYPSDRSVNLIATVLKIFGLLLIVFTQSDCWFSLVLILILVAFSLSIAFFINTQMSVIAITYLNKIFGPRKSVCVRSNTLHRHFPLISVEEFESHYMLTPKFLYQLAHIIWQSPHLIRKIRPSNRSAVALFAVDPEFYLSNMLLDENDYSDSDDAEISDLEEEFFNTIE